MPGRLAKAGSVIALTAVAAWAAGADTDAARPGGGGDAPAAALAPLWTYQDFLDGKLPPKHVVRTGHPRLLITPDNRADMLAKIQAGPGLWRQAIEKAENPAAARSPWQQMLACACIYQLGLAPGFQYKLTRDEYGRRAVELLLACDYGKNTPMGGNPKYFANCLAYDWLYDLLTAAQRKVVVAAMVQVVRSTGERAGMGPWRMPAVNSVDNQAFLFGLAFHGDGVDDAAAEEILKGAWNEVVWNPRYSDRCITDRARTVLYLLRMLEGGGNDEGINYFSSHDDFFVHAAAWKTAAGVDLLGHMGYFRNLPYWLSFMEQPCQDGSLGRLICLHGYCWSYSLWYGFPSVGGCVAAAGGYLKDADPRGASLARWWVDKTFGGAEKVPYIPGFLYGLLIGDPRVPPTPPREMKLPLTWVMRGFNYVFMRSDYWDNPDAAILNFANARYRYRAMASNDFALNKNGAPLFLCRAFTAFHGYTPPGSVSANRVVYYRGTELKANGLLLPSKEYHPDDDQKVMQVDSVPGEYDWVVGRVGNIVGSRVDKELKAATRTLVYLRPMESGGQDYVVLLDRTETADAALVPHVVFNTVFQPEVGPAWGEPAKGEPVCPGQSAFADAPCVTVTAHHEFKASETKRVVAHGRAFLRTLYPARVRVLTIGGPEHFLDDITGKGSLTHSPCSGFLKASPAEQIERGGYWRFDIVPTASATKHTVLNVIEPTDSKAPRPTGPMELVEAPAILGARVGANLVLFSRDGGELTSASATVARGGTVRIVIGDLKPRTRYALTCGRGGPLALVSGDAGTIFCRQVELGAGERIHVER